MSLLAIEDLDFSYRGGELPIPILKNFSLRLEQGDFVAIKGPSGSGKSTLLYLMAGLLDFDRGAIFFRKKKLTDMSPLQLASFRNQHLGFVFQQFHLLPKLSVLENILLPAEYPTELTLKGSDLTAEAQRIAKNLGIGDRLEHYPAQLSGGQQQRVAIARAVLRNPDLILADEPTGNLDSESTQQIIQIFKELNEQGKTIVLITHEDEVARSAKRILHFKDGRIVKEEINQALLSQDTAFSKRETLSSQSFRGQLKTLLPLAIKNAFRNRMRSFLTMVGIVVGVAAVCSMVTLGEFTKEKILASYTELGANTLLFRGYQNWHMKATQSYPLKFEAFDWENELLGLKSIFPSIQFISPVLNGWGASPSYGGRSLAQEGKLVGVSEDGVKVLGRELLLGEDLSAHHVQKKSSVCLIGYDIASQLFLSSSPIGKVLYVSQQNSNFACRILGVLKSKKSNSEWEKPNTQVIVPFSFYQSITDSEWEARIKEVNIQLKDGTDVERASRAIKKFFEIKYGASGVFSVDSDSILLAQMEKFLSLFTILLMTIALVSLLVGGMGITNMMLVSVSERLKEIGLRKSVGATNTSIRNQFLLESIVICFIAGLLGIFLGFFFYQTAIYGASKFTAKLEYEWVFNPTAFTLSFGSIFFVGVVSGLLPAWRAQKLQVIEALRSE